MAEDQAPAARAEGSEEEQNRPYRRFVRLVFAISILLISVLVLRGIIRFLDRLPTVVSMYKPERVDNRALAACADDLLNLEGRIRAAAGRAFASQIPAAASEDDLLPDQWDEPSHQLELERLKIVARCRLDEPSDDPVVRDLAEAAGGLESLLREYGLLYARHLKEGATAAHEVGAALLRANQALRER